MEIFRDIEGYEGLYQVSNYGNVKSLNYRHTGENRIMKQQVDKGGYLCIMFYKNGKCKLHKVHRLVASAFIPNPDNLPQVNHLDECKTNNNVENLEWCTAEYNHNYGTHNERMAETQRGVFNTKLSIPVDMLTKQGEVIRRFPSGMEAERWLRANGFPKASVSSVIKCCRGKRNIAHNFKWRYSKPN